MPKRTDLESILIIGSGPIVIGQACEFDYSGVQACRALREEGYKVILVNSNPATIMTDPKVADRTYIEPISTEMLEKIIAEERPDALLPTMGGQTALNCALALEEAGILERYDVELIGARSDAIQKAEDRQLFGAAMAKLGLEMPRGGYVKTIEDAWTLVKKTGFPAIIRPSFTMGGSGGAVVYSEQEFEEAIRWGLNCSPVSEVLLEESILGWKEYELEVMRDTADNVVIICSIENFDPMGVHTGDSITVAPAQTLSDVEYQYMRDASLRIIREIGVDTGGSNIQFGINPRDGRMVVIEMNPRVSRSSALASKATGFPIAKIAAKLAVGLHLDEIPNSITRKTPASFEPAIDYVVTKVPRWAFEKFPGADERFSTQMKSVGEAMGIGRTFRESFQKCLASLEIKRAGWGADGRDTVVAGLSDDERARLLESVKEELRHPTPRRVFELRTAQDLGMTDEEIYQISGIDPWFLDQLRILRELESELKAAAAGGLDGIPRALLRRAKRDGYSDVQIAHLCGFTAADVRTRRHALDLRPVYKSVDTCAAEFEAYTPYFYSTYEQETEVATDDRPTVIVLGSGPNRIGQGIEFDYCCVHAAHALRDRGFQTVMVNCNPETVSTDYDQVDRLYFEPLTLEHVLEIVDIEKPVGVLVQFGGQTPLKLATALEAAGVPIIGTSPDAIDLAEDRKRFEALCRSLDIRQPEAGTATSREEAREIAERIGYPVLLRPSYVLGGRGMAIVWDDSALERYIGDALAVDPDVPILVDRFLEGAVEVDVDCLADREGNVVIGGIMQHIEEAGIHSGDSSCVLPPYLIPESLLEEIRAAAIDMAKSIGVVGLMNLQLAIKDGKLYILEVNPRCSRTVPFVAKATGLPMARIAAWLSVGDTLPSLGLTESPEPQVVAVKKVVLPFAKFRGTDTLLGPEMRSTGEVMGVSDRFSTAFAKGTIAAGENVPLEGTVFISVRDHDKQSMVPIAADLSAQGFTLMGTQGTATFLQRQGFSCGSVFKVNEGRPNVVDAITNGDVSLVINTPLGEDSRFDDRAIRVAALQNGVPCITTPAAAAAMVLGIQARSGRSLKVWALQDLEEAAYHMPDGLPPLLT